MKKLILILFLATSTCIKSQVVMDLQVKKSDFFIVSGMVTTGIGFSLQPVTYNGGVMRYDWKKPGLFIPCGLGLGLTITGLIDGIRSERKKR